MSIPKGVPLGTRVKYVGDNPEIKGEEGTIIKFLADHVLVEFDNPCRWILMKNEGLVSISTIDDAALNALLLN